MTRSAVQSSEGIPIHLQTSANGIQKWSDSLPDRKFLKIDFIWVTTPFCDCYCPVLLTLRSSKDSFWRIGSKLITNSSFPMSRFPVSATDAEDRSRTLIDSYRRRTMLAIAAAIRLWTKSSRGPCGNAIRRRSTKFKFTVAAGWEFVRDSCRGSGDWRRRRHRSLRTVPRHLFVMRKSSEFCHSQAVNLTVIRDIWLQRPVALSLWFDCIFSITSFVDGPALSDLKGTRVI